MKKTQANLSSSRVEDVIEDSETEDDSKAIQDSETENDSEATEDSEIEDDSEGTKDSETTSSLLMNQQERVVHKHDTFEVQGMSTTRYLRYEEVPIPDWLKNHDLYKIGDWKAYKKPRSNGKIEWKYAHREYSRMFRSQPDVEWFLERILLEGRQIYNGKILQKRAADAGGQSGGNSSRNKCARGRGRGGEKRTCVVDSLPVPNGNSSTSNKAICRRGRGRGRGRGTSAVYGAAGNSSSSNMTISTRGRGRGTSAVCRAVDHLAKPFGYV